jgi:4-hydroxybenzoate polyprenyltransferase
VETEKELDIAALAKFDRVGVTAGASTPTWMINRVVRTLESIPGRGEGVIRPQLFRILWLLLATNLYVSLGGGLLTYSCDLLQGIRPQFDHFLIGFGYIFAMHNFNRFTDEKSGKFGDPIRGLFYQRYRWPLLVASAMALVMALTLAYGLGPESFYLLAGMSLFGILYSVHFIPGFLLPVIKVRGLNEIPGSKTFFVAMAWAFITTLVPAWGESRWPGSATLGVLVFVLMLIYVRSALFDVFDVQADRLVGKETLPVFIGEKRTIYFLHVIMGMLVVWLSALPGLGLLPATAFWLIPGVFYLIGLSVLYEKGHLRPGPKLDFYLESLLIIIAGLAQFGYELTGTF